MSTVTERARRSDALMHGMTTRDRCNRIAELEDIVSELLACCACQGGGCPHADVDGRCDLRSRARLLGLGD